VSNDIRNASLGDMKKRPPVQPAVSAPCSPWRGVTSCWAGPVKPAAAAGGGPQGLA
jgi:hypothetical protein